MGALYRVDFPSGKSYIGITASTTEQRFAEHIYNAKRGLGRGINRALRKYGHENAKVTTLVLADAWDYLVDLERKVIALFKTKAPHGYNMTDGGEGSLGYKHTPEALKKMGTVHRGQKHHTQPHSAEAKAKMSAAATGRKLSEATKAKIGAASRGNKYALGRKLSDEHKQAISNANLGRKWSDEARVRMSIAAKAREAKKRGEL